MTLDPQIAGMIEQWDSGFPPVYEMSGAEARAAIRSRFVPVADPERVADVTDRVVKGRGGPIVVRVYRPDASEPLPIMVYAHGGGFVFCDLDSHDGLCRSFANRIPAVIVSVDYRLAPENPWPAAAEDVYDVACWVSDNAAALGGDPSRLAVGGDSAGGNIAAVTAVMARDHGGPTLAGQLLVYPLVAADFDTESYRLFGKGYYNPKPALQWYWDCYVPSPADRAHPYVSPLQANLRGLPPAVVVIAGHDPLRDEGLSFDAGLQAAGVRTVQLCYEGGVHGFMSLPILDLAQRARREACAALSELLQR
jgi:acetyl esterase